MKTPAKIGLVAVGYVAAILVATAAVAIRTALTPAAVEQASSGMYAFGDSLLFIGVFSVVALIPTGMALFFLRPYRRFWQIVSGLALAVAVTGVAAAVIFQTGRHAVTPSTLTVWIDSSVLRILMAPPLALTFFVCTLFSPYRSPRLALAAATAMEVAVSAYAVIVWFLPHLVGPR